ncbi:MAG TPA: hypothetical protein VHW91_08710 [Candidatus Dormibacteraeota bacterium]|nr:hypothetical protein [Candidatus Dormibacteraeota bacterium]
MAIARALLRRLRRTWFGSLLALLGVALLTVIPAHRQCVGIAAVRGGVGGIFCSWTPPLESPREPGLLLLLAFATAIIVLPLVFPYRPVLLVSGIATALAVAGVVVMTAISYGFYLALARLGLDLTSTAVTATLAMLPAAGAWTVASFRLPANVGS